MTCMKKLTALLVSAALALSLLAGCGGSKALSQVIADLLSGQYNNVTVEVDPDLTAALKKAASAGSTQEEVLAALVENLNLSGGSITFSNLGDGQQGQHGVTLTFQPGSDPDAAARSAFTEWNRVFSSLPDDGSYRAHVSMIEAENGYYIAVDVEVLKAGTQDKDEPAILQSIAITTLPTKTQYNTGESFDPAGMVITAAYSDGSTRKIENITSSNPQGVTWSPAAITADTNVTITYGGKTAVVAVELITLTSISVTAPTKTQYNTGESFDSAGMTITATYSDGHVKDVALTECTLWIGSTEITSSYTFATAGTYTLTVEYQGVKSAPAISLQVKDKDGYHEENGVYVVTALEGLQNLVEDLKWPSEDTILSVNITLNCDVTLDAPWIPIGADSGNKKAYTGTFDGQGHTISELTATSDGNRGSYFGLFSRIGTEGKVQNLTLENPTVRGTYVGAVAGFNEGAIENCHVTGSGAITGKYAGGVVGINCGGTVTACSSTGDVTATGDSTIAGGVVGDNYSSGEVIACYATGNVTANGSDTYAGGVVGVNESSGTVTACCSTSSVSGYKAGGVVGSNANTVTACYATGDVTGNTYAGGVVGYNGRTVTACYSTGTVNGRTAGGVVGYNNGTVTDCYWSGSVAGDKGIGDGSIKTGATEVDGSTVKWTESVRETLSAMDAMNEALKGGDWQYLDNTASGNPPLTLKKTG